MKPIGLEKDEGNEQYIYVTTRKLVRKWIVHMGHFAKFWPDETLQKYIYVDVRQDSWIT